MALLELKKGDSFSIFINFLFIVADYGVRETGYKDVNTGKFVEVPEMIPEIVVPDLTDCKVCTDLMLSQLI